jgi:hypothetical protein
MAKDDNLLKVLLRVNSEGDASECLIFDVLSNCKNKTDLIKNALFNYIVNIQNGSIIDRAYPYNAVEKFTNIERERVIYAGTLSGKFESGANQELYNNENSFNNETEDNNIDYIDNIEEDIVAENNQEDNQYEDDNMDLI